MLKLFCKVAQFMCDLEFPNTKLWLFCLPSSQKAKFFERKNVWWRF
jgi:hypothetical protein